MTKISSLVFASLLLVNCGDAKDTKPAPTPTPTENPSPNNPTPNDLFKNGFCEVSINGAAPEKRVSSPAIKAWGDEVFEAVRLTCDGFDLVGYGDDSSLPMKPGKYPFYQPGGPKTGIFQILGSEPYALSGEVNIEVWGADFIKGTFEAKGSYGTKGVSDYKESVSFKGSFENKKRQEPYKPSVSGVCELSVGDRLPSLEPGNQFSISTAYWAGPNTKNPSWALQLNCGKYGFSAEKTSDLPMKPGKYKVGQDGPISNISPLSSPSGEFIIDSWDMFGIKGSFELKGAIMFATDQTPITVKGVFDYKCPYTKPGEPCLEKPN